MSEPLNYVSLFAGIGGIDLGLDRAGMNCVGQVEIDPYCRRVLAKHWPNVPRHDDVRTVPDWWTSEQRPRVDVVCGGFPCQPVSEAGRRNAQEDARWLWPEMANVIAAVQPEWVIGENVPGLLTAGITDVVSDLAGLGYATRVGRISACAVGATHTRSRLFILGHAVRVRCDERRYSPRPLTEQGWRGHADSGPSWWETEPPLARMAHGVPSAVDRIRALGNAVVPQVAEHVGRLIVAHHEASAVASCR